MQAFGRHDMGFQEGPMKEMDFSPARIRARWRAGRDDAARALTRADWLGDFSLLEGVILHQAGPMDDREPAIEELADAAAKLHTFGGSPVQVS
jgi:hypothetical protein